MTKLVNDLATFWGTVERGETLFAIQVISHQWQKIFTLPCLVNVVAATA